MINLSFTIGMGKFKIIIVEFTAIFAAITFCWSFVRSLKGDIGAIGMMWPHLTPGDYQQIYGTLVILSVIILIWLNWSIISWFRKRFYEKSPTHLFSLMADDLRDEIEKIASGERLDEIGIADKQKLIYKLKKIGIPCLSPYADDQIWIEYLSKIQPMSLDGNVTEARKVQIPVGDTIIHIKRPPQDRIVIS